MDENIQSSLVRFNGEIGPQYLDVEDKTDGPDGTLKPLTKDMLREMIVANFPELQNVKDSGALAELESVKAELQSLKEHTFNTQLTGSNVAQPTDLQYHNLSNAEPLPIYYANDTVKEFLLLDEITLEPGSSRGTSDISLTDCEKFRVGVITINHERTRWELTMRQRTKNGLDLEGGLSDRKAIIEEGNHRTLVTDTFDSGVPTVSFVLSNRDEVPMTASVYLFKIGYVGVWDNE